MSRAQELQLQGKEAPGLQIDHLHQQCQLQSGQRDNVTKCISEKQKMARGMVLFIEFTRVPGHSSSSAQ